MLFIAILLCTFKLMIVFQDESQNCVFSFSLSVVLVSFRISEQEKESIMQ